MKFDEMSLKLDTQREILYSPRYRAGIDLGQSQFRVFLNRACVRAVVT